MTSITTFGYGLTVRATELISASLAWPNLEPTFQFFDLLLMRRRRGTLQATQSDGITSTALEKVPEETWEEIKLWVVAMEMEDAEDKLLAPFTKGLCAPWEEEECACRDVPKVSWEQIREGKPECFAERNLKFNEDYCDMLGGYSFGNSGYLDPFHRLVAAFGLAHPLSRTITLNPDVWDSLDSIAFIAIPHQAQDGGSAHSTISAEAGFDSQDQHTIVNVSLDLPTDAEVRFVRFIRTFDLQVVDSTKTVLKCVAPDPERKTQTRSQLAGIKHAEVKFVNEIKPRWKLYTTCWGDW